MQVIGMGDKAMGGRPFVLNKKKPNFFQHLNIGFMDTQILFKSTNLNLLLGFNIIHILVYSANSFK